MVKKTNKKDLVKKVGSKSTCPKWHFAQLDMGAKTPYEGFFFTKILVQKSCDFLQ
jgi:hypothetical protein